MRESKKQVINLLCLAVGLMVLSGCASDHPQSIFNTAGPVAESVKGIFMFTFWLAVVVFAVVASGLTYVLINFRRHPDKEGSVPDQIHGSVKLEAIWTFIPILILIAIGLPTYNLIQELDTYQQPQQDDLVVNVTGYQWWWKFEYPELGITTANELHVPTGRRVILNLNSADVLHAFWLPRVAGKRDLIPAQTNQLWFEVDDPGIYLGQCAELCLGAHAYMRFRTVASPAADFEKWARAFNQPANQQAAKGDAAQLDQGKQLFMSKGCAGCHTIDGVSMGVTGPNLTNFGARTSVAAGVLDNTPENLARWLRDPQEVKPTNKMPTLWQADDPNRDQEIDALVAYLESLGADKPELMATIQAGR